MCDCAILNTIETICDACSYGLNSLCECGPCNGRRSRVPVRSRAIRLGRSTRHEATVVERPLLHRFRREAIA